MPFNFDDRPADTTPEAWDRFIEAHRRMTPEQRLQRTIELSEDLRNRILAGVRRRYPHASEHEVLVRYSAMMFDRDAVIRTFGWCPESDEQIQIGS